MAILDSPSKVLIAVPLPLVSLTIVILRVGRNRSACLAIFSRNNSKNFSYITNCYIYCFNMYITMAIFYMWDFSPLLGNLHW